MSYRIYKYEVPIRDSFTHEMPSNAKILSVQKQGDAFQMWALVDPTYTKVKTTFRIYGTGHDITIDCPQDHVGTFQDGQFVWHPFKEIRG